MNYRPSTIQNRLFALMALFMAIALVVYLPVAYQVFRCKMKTVKAEMKLAASRTLAEDELTHLVFSPTEQEVLERPEEREIKWEGKMYDIATEHFDQDGNLHVYALLDEREMELKRWVRKFLTNDASESPTKRSKSDVLKVFAKAIIKHKNDVDTCFFSDGKRIVAYTVSIYSDIELQVEVGPPQVG